MKYFINSTIIYTLANLWLIKVVVRERTILFQRIVLGSIDIMEFLVKYEKGR